MRSMIQKWGNSQAIRLPKAILEMAGLRENETVQIMAEENQIVIKKITGFRHKTLKERLAGFKGEYSFVQWDIGPSLRKEVC